MNSISALVGALSLGFVTATAASQQPQAPPAAGAATDVYHVHFTKAVPGQAAALATALSAPDPSAPMPNHFIVLRHQEGDDWDYAVIQHLGQKAAVEASPASPNPARDLRAWHTDTFAAGPSWETFTREMGMGGTSATPNAVYTLSVHRAAPGHRAQLEKALLAASPSSSKVQTGNLLLQHLEGGDWTFLAITRYSSWQDLANDRTAAIADAAGAGGWNDIRQHQDFHRDTIADRVFPK